MSTLIQAGLLAGLLVGIASAQNTPREGKSSEQPRIERLFSTEALDRAIPGLAQFKHAPETKAWTTVKLFRRDTSQSVEACATRLVEVPIQQDTEFVIGKIRPAGNIDRKSFAKVPAPPCAEESR
jgi:hypothetical protein